MAKKAQHGGKRKGAGRPPKDDKTVVIAASVPEALAADLDGFAKAKGWSRSRAVTEALRGLLKRKSRT
jgi:metal-responsive CopG/Arc/MetJ family transcriptional regulator